MPYCSDDAGTRRGSWRRASRWPRPPTRGGRRGRAAQSRPSRSRSRPRRGLRAGASRAGGRAGTRCATGPSPAGSPGRARRSRPRDPRLVAASRPRALARRPSRWSSGRPSRGSSWRCSTPGSRRRSASSGCPVADGTAAGRDARGGCRPRRGPRRRLAIALAPACALHAALRLGWLEGVDTAPPGRPGPGGGESSCAPHGLSARDRVVVGRTSHACDPVTVHPATRAPASGKQGGDMDVHRPRWRRSRRRLRAPRGALQASAEASAACRCRRAGVVDRGRRRRPIEGRPRGGAGARVTRHVRLRVDAEAARDDATSAGPDDVGSGPRADRRAVLGEARA